VGRINCEALTRPGQSSFGDHCPRTTVDDRRSDRFDLGSPLSPAAPRRRPDPNLTERGGERFFARRPIVRMSSGRLSITPSPCLRRGDRVRRTLTRFLSALHFPIPLWEDWCRQAHRRECRGSRSRTKSSFDVRSSQAPTFSMRLHSSSHRSSEVHSKIPVTYSTSMRSSGPPNRSFIGKVRRSGVFPELPQDSGMLDPHKHSRFLL